MSVTKFFLIGLAFAAGALGCAVAFIGSLGRSLGLFLFGAAVLAALIVGSLVSGDTIAVIKTSSILALVLVGGLGIAMVDADDRRNVAYQRLVIFVTFAAMAVIFIVGWIMESRITGQW